MKSARLFLLVFTFVVITCIPVAALNIQPGDYVQLRTTNLAGVPLHKESKSSMFTRLPDGSIVKVLQIHSNWLQVSHDGLTGWIVKRHVEKIFQPESGNGSTPAMDANTPDVWRSPDMCNSAVNKGARLPRAPGTIRVVTWNLRWFPQGTLYGHNQDKFTNQAWLSCAHWLG